MLIGLNFAKDDSREFKEEFGIKVAEHVGSRTRVFESRNLQEYLDILRDYSPAKRDNLVLINTHLDFKDELSTGKWRATDIAFNQKGGVIYGEEPPAQSSVYKTRFVEEDPDFMVHAAHYYGERAKSMKKELKDYIGRSDSDPHTLVLGFTPSWPRLSVAADALMGGLPEGGDDPWWWGVGFYNYRNKASKSPEDSYKDILDRFYFASRVVVSDKAQEILDSLGEPYQRAENVHFRTLPEGVKFGKNLRSLSRVDAERVVV